MTHSDTDSSIAQALSEMTVEERDRITGVYSRIRNGNDPLGAIRSLMRDFPHLEPIHRELKEGMLKEDMKEHPLVDEMAELVPQTPQAIEARKLWLRMATERGVPPNSLPIDQSELEALIDKFTPDGLSPEAGRLAFEELLFGADRGDGNDTTSDGRFADMSWERFQNFMTAVMALPKGKTLVLTNPSNPDLYDHYQQMHQRAREQEFPRIPSTGSTAVYPRLTMSPPQSLPQGKRGQKARKAARPAWRR